MKHPVRQWIHVIFISIACCIISSTGNISTVEAKTLNHTDGWFVSFSYPDPNKYGRIWIPPEAIKGTTLPLVILYHGAINGSVGSSDNPLDTTSGYVGPKARRRVDSIVHEQIKKGTIPPLIIAAPIDGTNRDGASFTRSNTFEFDTLIHEIEKEVTALGYGIDKQRIILAGHSNGGTGFYNTLFDKNRTTSIIAGAVIDTGLAENRPEDIMTKAVQKPTAFIGIGASNYPQGSPAWIANIKETFGDERETSFLPCDATVFASCKQITQKQWYYYQVDVKKVSDSHNEAVNLFFGHGLPLLFSGAIQGQEDAFLNIDELKEQLINPTIKTQIPGLSFTDIKAFKSLEQVGDNIFLQIPFLGEYMAALYRFGVAAIILITIIVIIVSGGQLAISGLSADQAQSAKERIARSLIGLLLAIGSYTILYLVNPNLVSFKNLRVLIANKSTSAITRPTDTSIGSAGSTITCNSKLYAAAQHILAVGDSITVGVGANNISYADRLIKACPTLGKMEKIALGGKGTKELFDSLSPRDLRTEGFHHIIILGGINDIINEKSTLYVTTHLETMYKKAKEHGLRVIAVTISPFGEREKIWNLTKQQRLEEVNKWIYSQQGKTVDIVIDFNQLIQDKENPYHIAEQYDKDHIHPNEAAHDLLAAEIARKAFQ